jgi:1,4-dihydroxy-2-naphthoate octaprenyltransferase
MGQDQSDNANDALWGIRDYFKENNKSLKDVFKDLDDDENKKITVEEFKEGLLKLGIANLTETAVDNLVSTLDENGDGEINLKEFKSAYKDNLPAKIVNPEDFSSKKDSEYTSIITCDMEGRIETFNEGASAIFGYSPEETIGKLRVSKFSPGRVVLGHIANWLKTASTEGKYEGDTTFVHKDGSLIAAHVEITPTFKTIDGNKTQIGYCGKTRVIDKDPLETMPEEPWWVTPLTWVAITRAPFVVATWMPILFAMVWAFNGGIENLSWDAGFSLPLFVLVFVGGSTLHLSANVFNDYFDWQSGVDQANNDYFLQYSGGSRAIELEIITEKGLFNLGTIFIGIAALCGVALMFGPWAAGLELLIYAGIGALGGYFYTAPPLRLAARSGLGELSIGLLFGPVLTMGTVYGFSGIHSCDAFLIGIPLGLLTTAILWINEFPDTPSDIETGKIHLVAALGIENARWGYLGLIVLAYISTILLAINEITSMDTLLVLITAPGAAWLTYRLFQDYQSRDLVSTNISTIGLQAVAGILFIIGSCELF